MVPHNAKPLIAVFVITKTLLINLVSRGAYRNYCFCLDGSNQIQNVFSKVSLVPENFFRFNTGSNSLLHQKIKFLPVRVFPALNMNCCYDTFVSRHHKLVFVSEKTVRFWFGANPSVLIYQRPDAFCKMKRSSGRTPLASAIARQVFPLVNGADIPLLVPDIFS